MSWVWLVLAGVGAGLVGSIAGLASLASYPALLAVGLGPLAANVTNTVALVATTVGTVLGSRRELAGQGRRVLRLCAVCMVGGAAGGVLLLTTPASAFAAVVPWLVALGAVLLLLRDRLRVWARTETVTAVSLWWVPVLLLVGVYAGYFGAGAGVIMLAVLSLTRHEPLPVTNAMKNVGTGAANGVAAVGYAAFGPVHWAAVLPLAAGALVGSAVGPGVVRFLPDRPLRIAIAVAGLGLAVHLATS